MLGMNLGEIIRTHDPEVFNAVEILRDHGRKWRSKEYKDGEHFDAMVKEVESYSTEKLKGVARAFTHFLALSNSAENHHPFSPKEDSMTGCVKKLVESQRQTKEEVYNALCQQKIEIVLTAHPTEVNRRTMLQKHTHIKEILAELDRTDLTSYEIRQLEKQLHSEIACIWETDELRRSKPSPVEEARGGMHIVSDVLWDTIPKFVRKLSDVCVQELGSPLPMDASPIKIASWMGGDRDGNPNVTPAITQEVSANNRALAAELFLQDIKVLHNELSLQKGTEELMIAA
eukprot:GSChrysophyteH1.ASY1.ANO1.2353.1 assembled CDS